MRTLLLTVSLLALSAPAFAQGMPLPPMGSPPPASRPGKRRFACSTRICARRSFGGASRPAISTVPATRRPSSIGVMPKPRLFCMIGRRSSIEGEGREAW